MLAQQSIPFWESLIIMDESGIVLYSDSDFSDNNVILIGGFFQAIESLFKTEFDDELRELRGVKYHASVIQKQVNSNIILFMGLTRSETCEKKRRKELEYVAIQFIKKFHPLIKNYINEPGHFKDFKKIPKTRKETALTQISDSLQLNPKITPSKMISSKMIKKEILRILKFLKLPLILKQALFQETRKYLEIFDPRSKFHYFKKCIPIALYLYCMEHHIVIDWRELTNVSHITEKELKAVIFQLENYNPEDNQDK